MNSPTSNPSMILVRLTADEIDWLITAALNESEDRLACGEPLEDKHPGDTDALIRRLKHMYRRVCKMQAKKDKHESWKRRVAARNTEVERRVIGKNFGKPVRVIDCDADV